MEPPLIKEFLEALLRLGDVIPHLMRNPVLCFLDSLVKPGNDEYCCLCLDISKRCFGLVHFYFRKDE